VRKKNIETCIFNEYSDGQCNFGKPFPREEERNEPLKHMGALEMEEVEVGEKKR